MNLNREILRLALPSILANITVPLVGMVDIAVAGHLGTEADATGGPSGLTAAALIGGISVGSMLFDMLYWNFGFLRTGTGGLTAQAYGRLRRFCPLLFASNSPRDGRAPDDAIHPSPPEGLTAALRDIADTHSRALGIAIGSGLVLIAVQWLVVQAAFLVVRCTPEVRLLAERYFYIRIWAAPATLSLFAFKGWFIGMQDTVRPMVCDLLVNGLNILLSIGLAFGLAGLPALGFSGVATGTVIAQWSGFLYAALAVHHRYGPWIFRGYTPADAIRAFRPLQEPASTGQPGGLRAFFTLNRDLVVRSMGMIAVYIGFTVISARYGDLMLAVSTILMKLLMIFSYFTDGFAYAGEALTGRFIGERSADGVRSTVRGTFAWSMGIAGLFVLAYAFGGIPAVRLMTSDNTVVDASREFLPWLLLMPLIGCPAFTWDGIYVGATASRPLRNATLWCAVGFFTAWGLGIILAGPRLSDTLAIHILMAAYFVHLAIRTLYQSARYRSAILSPHFGE